MHWSRTVLVLVGALVVSGSAVPSAGAAVAPRPYAQDGFERPDGLVTNAHAYASPTARTAVGDGRWEMTSGSLFARAGVGWTGVPDASSSGIDSRVTTGSSVFRMRSHRTDLEDVTVRFDARVLSRQATARTPAQNWDGLRVWLRYKSDKELYIANVDVRSGYVSVQKKVPGGSSNGGTYYTLAPLVKRAVPLGTWQRDLSASVHDEPDGGVTIDVRAGGRLITSVTDRGTRKEDGSILPPIRGRGRVGFRGDNAQFELDNVVVTPFGGSSAPSAQAAVVRMSTPASTVYGSALGVTGRAWMAGKPAGNLALALQRRTAGTGWTTVEKRATDATGRVTFAHAPLSNAEYMVRSVAKGDILPGSSPRASVAVRTRMFVKASSYAPARGTAVVFSGTVTPARAGQRVVLQQVSAAGSPTVATGATDSAGRYSIRYVPAKTADYRASVASTPGLEGGRSGAIRVAVR